MERLVYINDNLVGYFRLCISEADKSSSDIFMPEPFFDQAKLRKTGQSIVCHGTQYWKPQGSFMRLDTKNMVMGTVKAEDYSTSASVVNDGSAAVDGAKAVRRQEINTSVLQHHFGIWYGASGGSQATLGITGRQYSSIGLFSIDGYAAAAADRKSGYFSNVNWKRDFRESGVAANAGLHTIGLSGASMRLFGLVMEIDQEAQRETSTQMIDGFAEAPGRLQISSHGTLLWETQVSAGYFSVPTAGLPQAAGATGQYTLTLIDQLGRPIRTWEVFVPVGSQLLRPGASTWKAFAGQIETGQSSRALVAGPRNLGIGGSYRRGLSSYLTGDISSFITERDRGSGAALDFAPLSWLSMNAGAARRWGKESSFSAYGSVNLQTALIGASASYLMQSCKSSNPGDSVGRCSSMRLATVSRPGRWGGSSCSAPPRWALRLAP